MDKPIRGSHRTQAGLLERAQGVLRSFQRLPAQTLVAAATSATASRWLHVLRPYRGAQGWSPPPRPAAARDRSRPGHPPQRLLFYEAMYPLRTETYMTDECDALEARGFQVAVARHFPSSGPIPVHLPVYAGLDEAVADFKPDAVLMHWASHAAQERGDLARVGIPFGVRVHSFDARTAFIDELRSDPNCFGIWAFPHFAKAWRGTLPLPAIFPHTELFAPDPKARRRGAVIVAASLPKRNWPMVHDVFDRLPGIEKRIVLGTTNEYEQLSMDVLLESNRRGQGTIVQINVDRDEVARMLQRSSVLLYTLQEANREIFGMPQGVIEAMLCGASVVLPDWPFAHELAGPSARYYQTQDDIVRHLQECEAGGPAVEAERTANRAWMLSRVGGPKHADRFAGEIRQRLAAWNRARPKWMPAPVSVEARTGE